MTTLRMKVKFGPFELQYAEGYAAGVEHVNDSSIDNVKVEKGDDGWYVTFDDGDEQRGEGWQDEDGPPLDLNPEGDPTRNGAFG